MSDLQEAILNAYADIMRELIGAFISILYESKISLPIRKTYDGPFGYGKRYSMYEYENFYLKERDFERLIIMLDSLQVEKGRNWKIRIYAVDILNPYTKLPKLMYSNRNAPYPIDSPEAALLWFLSPTIEETSLDRNELQKLLNKAVKIQLEAISDQLKQVEDRSVKTPFLSTSVRYDVFICHATEDKDSFVRPLVEALIKKGLCVWYDEFSLKLGDKLRESIEKGLINSRYGAVILSKNFFAKKWPQEELNGLFSLEEREKKILPIWHQVNREEVKQYSPILSGRVAADTSKGISYVVEKIFEVVREKKEK